MWPWPSLHLSLVPKGRSSTGRSCLEMGSATSPWSELLTNQRGWLLCFSLFVAFLFLLFLPPTGPRDELSRPENRQGADCLPWVSRDLPGHVCRSPGGLGGGCRIPGSPPDPATASPPPFPASKFRSLSSHSVFGKAAALCFCFGYYLREAAANCQVAAGGWEPGLRPAPWMSHLH